MEISPIGYIYTDFKEKFGLPRQSNIVEGLYGKIVPVKEFRKEEAFRALEGYSYIWLLWYFDKEPYSGCLTVRPPRLGGNTRVGVFASRSPNRPNSIGMSVVKLVRIDYENPEGPVLYVDGIDMLDGTPIIDIKPYIKASDSLPDAVCGFADVTAKEVNTVSDPCGALGILDEETQKVVVQLLEQNPSPRYIDDPDRIFGFEFRGFEIKYRVKGHEIAVAEITAL